jgi:membrane protease YdiL (CAAX protease family)
MRWLQVRIVKLRQIAFVAARPTRGAFEMLEPCEGRLSCTVLRGLGGSNAPWLPDRAANRQSHAPVDVPQPVTPANVLGNMTFQWIVVGLSEETMFRGLIQIYLMNNQVSRRTVSKQAFLIQTL